MKPNALLMGIVLACTGLASQNVPEQRYKDERQIYRLIFAEKVRDPKRAPDPFAPKSPDAPKGVELMMVTRTPSAPAAPGDDLVYEPWRHKLTEEWLRITKEDWHPVLDADTWSNFLQENKTAGEWAALPAIFPEHRWHGAEEVQKSWLKPGDFRVVVFARPGFNRKRTQALTYVAYWDHRVDGGPSEGWFFLLRKEHGRWVVQKASQRWSASRIVG